MRKRRWLAPALVIAGAIAFVLLARVLEADEERIQLAGRTIPDLCPARFWDRRCLGCGLTRASVQLAHGDWAAAWRTHPGAYVLLAAVLLEASAMLWTDRARYAARWTLAALLLLVAVLNWHSWNTRL